MTVRILTGHVLDRLADLETGSVQCVVTSPPYYGLRAYGTEPQVWAITDEQKACGHEWSTEVRTISGGGYSDKSTLVGFSKPDTKGRVMNESAKAIASDTCQLCGCWRGELGQEPQLSLFLDHLIAVFRAVRRVLRDDGLLFVNLGDSYASSGGVHKNGSYDGGVGRKMAGVPRYSGDDGLKPKDRLLVPHRFAIAMQEDGWTCRADIIWAKTAPMPESVTDRPTTSHEHVFMFAKQSRYFCDMTAVAEPGEPYRVKEPDGWDTDPGAHGSFHRKGRGDGRMTGEVRSGRNLRDVWVLGPSPFPEAHFATFPPEIPRRCILMGTSEKGCCAVCGAPWRRVVERGEPQKVRGAGASVAEMVYDGTGRYAKVGPGSVLTSGTIRAAETVGWLPTCRCGTDETRPCTVLDIFAGSGTTGLVADRLGRDAVLIDLSDAYVPMMFERITNDAPMFAEVAVEAAPRPRQAALTWEE